MARLAVTFTVIVSFIVLVHARTPFDLPGNDVNERDPSNTLPISDPWSAILLPSEKLESEAGTVWSLPESDPVMKQLESDTTSGIPMKEISESETDTIAAAELTRPLTVTSDIRFRPINRHYHHMHVKQPLPFHFPHRCRHHRKPFGPRFRREIPYGNDMLVADQKDSFDHMFHGDVRQIPGRSVGFPFEKRQIIPFRPIDALTEEEVKMPRHHHHHHVEEHENEMEEEREEGGYMKQFRKFLNRF